MSDTTFDTVETTLKSLKDIVDRNHSQSPETCQLVETMENLLAELKSKSPVDVLLMFEPPTLTIHD